MTIPRRPLVCWVRCWVDFRTPHLVEQLAAEWLKCFDSCKLGVGLDIAVALVPETHFSVV